ncbi:hypothetical protein PSTG_08999 [Puccinia striiformis f. sp. tritici PST-78]|uniref:Uncharacterized protein n=1 Tax=Puccinia striiformis f. sp. tritici PST-78 TaxID=1165861 RepID=A0A0L0VF04_9BASI|nr:hypothetical protein PSTG_08999 [Puccinia striiformis f. sp. tritici PST-78]
MSQEDSSMRAFELDIDDPRLPELQSVEHAEHVRTTFSQHRKQYNQRKASQRDKSSNVNTSAIAEKVKAAIRLNARKRKAQWAQRAITKKRRVTLGKHRVRQVSRTQKASILKCFNRRGGPYGLVHTHQWWALV